MIHHPFKPGVVNNMIDDVMWSNSHLRINDVVDFERKLPDKMLHQQQELKGNEVTNADDVKALHASVIERRQIEHKPENDKIAKTLEEIS